MKISLLVTGRMYHAAESLPESLELADDTSLDALLEAVNGRLDDALPDTCLIAVSGEHMGTVREHPNRPLRDGDEVVLISPVAGG